MALTTVVVGPPSVLGKRSRASNQFLLHLSSSPEPQPVASTSKSLPILINGTLVSNTKKRYKCTHPGCDKAYSKPSRLEEHGRSHSGQRPFVCEKCDKSYLRETHLQAHARSHCPNSERPFLCPEPNCEKRFWTAQHLRVHTDSHNCAKPFTCPETDCKEAFTKHHQLRAHRCNVHAAPGTKPYQCDHEGCTQSFSTNQHLRTHSKVHNEKRYTCANPTCLAEGTIKFFPTWTALQTHNRSEHPPTCAYSSCNGRTFTSQKGLRAHQKLHEQQATEAEIDAAIPSDSEEEERPRKKRRGGELGRDWQCDVNDCTKDFKSKKALTTHIKITHLGRRDFTCPRTACRQTFGYKHLLQRHLAKHDASSEHSDEDGRPHWKSATVHIDIDAITGSTYTQTAQRKMTAAKALRCPHPNLDGLAILPNSEGTRHAVTCDYVFSRAYDLRRHLQAEHAVVVDKDGAERWVQRLKKAGPGSST